MRFLTSLISRRTAMPDQRDAIPRLRKAHYAPEDLPETMAFPQHPGDVPSEPLPVVEATVDDIAFQPQIDGSKTGLELPGIVDQVIAMTDIPDPGGQPQRAFVCQTLNPWGYPAKDRSGRLDMVEPPHLGRLMEKIQHPAAPASERLVWPPVTPADPTPSQEPGHG